jgi:hypothetical protein
MIPNRIMRAGVVRRALLVAVAAAMAAALLGACGSGGGGSSTAATDQEADAEILNVVLARQSAAVGAYDRIMRGLGGPALKAAGLFRAQEEEHVDGILKALRGLGEAAEPEAEEIPVEGLKTEAEHLAFLYELESATIEDELSAIARLTAASPRALLAATAANQAQHLVLLRRLLGAKPLESIPEPFESGTTPAP